MWELTDVISLILLCPMAWVDMKTKRIPIIYLWLLAAGSIFQQCFSEKGGIALMLGGIAVGIVFLILSKVTEEEIGYGDSLGILILGVGLGMWKLLEVLTTTFFILFVWSMIIWCVRKKKNQLTPFYPFLAVGYFLVFLMGVN